MFYINSFTIPCDIYLIKNNNLQLNHNYGIFVEQVFTKETTVHSIVFTYLMCTIVGNSQSDDLHFLKLF